MDKGIVMEINESNIIVMTSSGRFDKLPRGSRACEVGEEIVYAETVMPRFKVPPLAIASGLIAAMVLCFVLITGLRGTTANGEVVAYVSIDINPSVEIGIDSQEIVRDLRGINTDGVELIASLSYQGKTLEEVTSAILDRAEQGALAKGEGDIVISSTVVQDNANINDEAIADKLRQQVNKHIALTHPTQVKNYEVTAFASPQEVREEAKVSGVSTGKYAVYLNALNNGTKVSRDDIQNLSIHQLAKENGGISKLIDPGKPITKSVLKELVVEEKNGKLAEKLQEKEDRKSGTTDNNKSNEINNNKGKNNDSNDDKNSGKNDDKNIRNDRSSEGGNQNSSWNDFINRGNNTTDNSKNGSSKNDSMKNDDKNNMNKGNSVNNRNDSNNDSKNNNDKSVDDIKRDTGRNDNNQSNDDQRGRSGSSDKPVSTLKPSPTTKPSSTPKLGNRSDSGSDSDSKKDRQRSGEKDKQNEDNPKKTD
jgi:hypothetical protein